MLNRYMCISFPARVISISDDGAVAEVESILDGSTLHVNILFIPEVGVGDHIVVHSGIGVRVISQEEVMHICSILESDHHEGR